ncbi:MAG TPA: RIP metalloprotease RseP [Alphaproteobacteria bacterium]|nr:RIP metalloprotease RseP [Alphaproteobacteria bacterium]
MTSIFDLFQLIASNIWFYGGTFVLVLSVLVFVHEWGHYIVARMCGVKVETFSIGFGKEIFGWTDKRDTRWKVSLIPLGGYVKMFGDTDPASSGHTDGVKEGEKVRPFTEEEKKVAFFTKSVAKRAAIVFAGPAINFIFAVALLFCLYAFYGQPVTAPMASAVIEGSAADKGGFKPHDKLVSIDGEKIHRFEDIRRIVMVALDTPLEFVVEREGQEVTLTAAPEKQEMTDRFGFTHSRGMLGIIGPGNGIAIQNIVSVAGKAVEGEDNVRKALLANMDKDTTISLNRGKDEEGKDQIDVMAVRLRADLNEGLTNPDSVDYNAVIVADRPPEEILKHGVVNGITAALAETWNITSSTLTALGQIFTGMRSATELGGIIRIGAIAGDMAQAGFLAVVTFTALLSINLGLINLFPIPMLDGGHLVFYGIEAVKGKPVSEKVQEYAFRFGFAVLVGMMLFANLNDIVQLIM